MFSYPGIGYKLLQAVNNNDYPLMQGIFLVITLAVLGANLVVDLLYGFIDPRTRLPGDRHQRRRRPSAAEPGVDAQPGSAGPAPARPSARPGSSRAPAIVGFFAAARHHRAVLRRPTRTS